MKNIKVMFFIFILIVAVNISLNVYGKYVLEQTITVVHINIDRIVPKIETISISNNGKNINYANRNDTIIATIKVIEKNIQESKIRAETVKILVGEKEEKNKIEIEEADKKEDFIIYNIKMKDIIGNGILKIVIPYATVIDKSNNVNEEKVINTNIMIDNTN